MLMTIFCLFHECFSDHWIASSKSDDQTVIIDALKLFYEWEIPLYKIQKLANKNNEKNKINIYIWGITGNLESSESFCFVKICRNSFMFWHLD